MPVALTGPICMPRVDKGCYDGKYIRGTCQEKRDHVAVTQSLYHGRKEVRNRAARINTEKEN